MISQLSLDLLNSHKNIDNVSIVFRKLIERSRLTFLAIINLSIIHSECDCFNGSVVFRARIFRMLIIFVHNSSDAEISRYKINVNPFNKNMALYQLGSKHTEESQCSMIIDSQIIWFQIAMNHLEGNCSSRYKERRTTFAELRYLRALSSSDIIFLKLFKLYT